jgi:hypothetical protein
MTAERYTVGPLAHMLKNCMYVGEVAYRGEVHKGEHPATVHREVFDRVQRNQRNMYARACARVRF